MQLTIEICQNIPLKQEEQFEGREILNRETLSTDLGLLELKTTNNFVYNQDVCIFIIYHEP